MRYHIEQECALVKDRNSPTSIPFEVAVFENGDRVKIDWIETMPEGKTLKDVMTLGRQSNDLPRMVSRRA